MLILQILKILKSQSSEDKPITQTKIKELLEQDGLSCDRKTISRNINYLVEFGCNIVKIPGGGCYYDDDTFDDSELIFLVDCIYSSPAISQKQALTLIQKLAESVSYKIKQRCDNIYKVGGMTRTENKQVLYNIEQINYAINHNHKISFIYNSYDIDKNLTPRKQERYEVNPYFMINSNGRYFLVCNKEIYNNLSNYRIDYMTCVNVLENTTIKPITKTIANKNGVNPAIYASEHIYMFSGESVTAKLKLSSEEAISKVIDWFGKNAEIVTYDGTIYAIVKANEKALVYWCLQYGRDVEIVEPYQTRDLIKIELNYISKKYED